MKTFLSIFLAVLLLPVANQAQVLNGDFEDLNDTLPANWYSGDFGAGLKSNYAQSGTYSLAVWNWYYYAKGFVVNGSANANQFTNMAGSGTPSTEKALFLTGYYFYDTTGTNTNNDTALVTVAYRKWDNTNLTYDTVAFGVKYLLPTSGNSPVGFSVAIDDLAPGVDPDTVLIYIQSSLGGFCDADAIGNCLYLYVDNLKLENANGVTDVMGQFNQPILYPNPATNMVTVLATEPNSQWQLYDLAGKQVQSSALSTGENHLDISAQPSGIYVAVVTENGNIIAREKLIKQ